jgi:transcriptional regulator with XRE-family HTH domain
MLAIASTMVRMVRIPTAKIGEQLGSLGEFIAAQRKTAQLSLRQLAEQTGISNPYLSQIERGLRKPSAEVLLQLSKVEMAVVADTAITERQKHVLIDVYTSFVKENEKATTNGKPDYDNAKPTQGGGSDGSQGNLS